MTAISDPVFRFLTSKDASFLKFFQPILRGAKVQCANEVRIPYVREVLQKTTLMLLVFKSENKERMKRPDGFALLYDLDEGATLFLDVICAPGYGKAMIQQLQQYAREHRYHWIKLHALVPVIGFYRSLGFKITETGCKEPSSVSALADTLKGQRFKSVVDAMHNPKMLELVKAMENEKLESVPGCLQKSSDIEGVTACYRDGFPMTYCVSAMPAPLVLAPE